jgi:hypothetical protein
MREYLYNVHLDLVVPVRVIAEDEDDASTLAEQEVERVNLKDILPFCDVVNSDSCVVSDTETDETEESATVERLIHFI